MKIIKEYNLVPHSTVSKMYLFKDVIKNCLLINMQFKECVFDEVVFENCILENSKFIMCQIRNLKLPDIRGVTFLSGKLSCNFSGKDIKFNNFTDVVLNFVNAKETSFLGSKFTNVNFNNCNFENADFSYCSFRNINFVDTYGETILDNANFYQALVEKRYYNYLFMQNILNFETIIWI